MGCRGTASADQDADRALTQVNLPGGATISFDRDAAGRPWRVRHADGALLIKYEESTGRVASLASPHVSTSFDYDGPLVTKTTLSGPVSGSVAYRYDDHFRLVGTTVDAGAEVGFEYDGDGRLVRAGDYAFRYDPATGLPSQADGLAVTEELAFSEYAELQSTKVTTPNRHVLTFEYVRDDLGRVTAKKETVGAEDPVLFEYSYDASNRLTEVRRDGVVEGAWTYDAQGNRATETRKGKTATGVFDSGDRLLSWGATTYTWGPAGDLQSRTRPGEPKATYKYDALGNLLEARLPDGRKVEYLVDHAGRRVGKKVGGVLVQRFLWESPLRIAAEFDGEGNLVSRFVYGTKVNVPELIIKHGVTYRVLTDELGSPRLVFDPATEAVVQRMDYDAWGNVTGDSNPGFQPFGFAGGLWDRDLGWVRFGARDSDPETGTWTRPEPILSSAGAVAGYAAAGVRLGKYAYAGNNPVVFVDPTGMIVWNMSDNPVYVKDESSGMTRQVNPGEIDWGNQDGVASPATHPGQVYKSVDFVDVIVKADGTMVALSGLPMVLMNGWKESSYATNRRDWDEIFELSRRTWTPLVPQNVCQ